MDDDRRKRQTFTATPAEPGDLPWWLELAPALTIKRELFVAGQARDPCRRYDVTRTSTDIPAKASVIPPKLPDTGMAC